MSHDGGEGRRTSSPLERASAAAEAGAPPGPLACPVPFHHSELTAMFTIGSAQNQPGDNAEQRSSGEHRGREAGPAARDRGEAKAQGQDNTARKIGAEGALAVPEA